MKVGLREKLRGTGWGKGQNVSSENARALSLCLVLTITPLRGCPLLRSPPTVGDDLGTFEEPLRRSAIEAGSGRCELPRERLQEYRTSRIAHLVDYRIRKMVKDHSKQGQRVAKEDLKYCCLVGTGYGKQI